ncbi:hypothetical protein IWX47DRAFT_623003 [Phyllosticta citricarpa]
MASPASQPGKPKHAKHAARWSSRHGTRLSRLHVRLDRRGMCACSWPLVGLVLRFAILLSCTCSKSASAHPSFSPSSADGSVSKQCLLPLQPLVCTRTSPTFRCVLADNRFFATDLRIRNMQQRQLLTEAHDLVAIYNVRQHEHPNTQQRNQVTMLRLASLLALLDPTNAYRRGTPSLNTAVGRNFQLLTQRAAEVRRQLDDMAKELNSVERLHANNPRDWRDTADDDCCCFIILAVVAIAVILLVILCAAHKRQQEREAMDPHYALRNTRW